MTPSFPPAHPSDEANPAPTVEDKTTSPIHLPPRLRRRRRLLAGGAVTLALLVTVALSVALLAHARAQTNGVDLSSVPRVTSIPPGWRWYREPDGYFSVAIPARWTASRDTGVTTMGDRTGNDTFTTTDITLGGPPRGRQTITVSFIIAPIADAFERHWYCQSGTNPGMNAKVAGLPSFYDPVFGWLLDTSGAHFQISYTYPGYQGDIAMTSAPTPIPQAELTQGQQEMATILGSFRPNPPTPLTCP